MAFSRSFHNKHARHELKYLLSHAEYLILKSRIAAVMDYDKHAGENGYFIRSIYFDDLRESAYHEKLWGICDRRKIRIRAYDNDPSHIVLECKEKENMWVSKASAAIDRDTCDALIQGDFSALEQRREEVCKNVYVAFREKGLKPSVIVDYHREPFVMPISNLRITFDQHLHAGGITGFSMFGKGQVSKEVEGNKEVIKADNEIGDDISVPIYPDSVILEVKYDNYLPDMIRMLIPKHTGAQLSISKYCICKTATKTIKY